MSTDDMPSSARYGTCPECGSARYPVGQVMSGLLILRLACRCWPPGVNEVVADAAAAQTLQERVG